MKASLKTFSLIMAVLFAAGALWAGEAPGTAKAQTNCPVMGGKINKELFEDYEGKRVYFCCEGCRSAFKAEPDKYVNKLEDQGVTLEKAAKLQTTCPVMGGKINKKIYTDHKDKRVYFCCEGCIQEFKKDPEKYIKKLEDQGVTLMSTAHAGCPHHKGGKECLMKHIEGGCEHHQKKAHGCK